MSIFVIKLKQTVNIIFRNSTDETAFAATFGLLIDHTDYYTAPEGSGTLF